jgi:hypothetical protein
MAAAGFVVGSYLLAERLRKPAGRRAESRDPSPAPHGRLRTGGDLVRHE